MIFGSDNMVGASDAVMAALLEANAGTAPSYGADPWTERAGRLLNETFEREVTAFFVATGTAANCLALAALTRPWEAVLCHAQAHIRVDESSGPEFFTGGARLIALPDRAGKLTADLLAAELDRLPARAPHNVLPAVLSLTQASECGLVYSVAEVTALAAEAHARGLAVHMDGARFANALVATGASPAEMSWKAGVDVLCLGASKNGALACEAVIFFDAEKAAAFANIRKRGGHLISKGRLFGAQCCGWLEGGDWLRLAAHSNAMARRLGEGLARLPGVSLGWPVEANEVFPLLPVAMIERLRAAGAYFYDWPAALLPVTPGPDEAGIRLVTSFRTTADEVEAFLSAASAA
ncbi:threonine aldolase family protein [Segnochrobactraceae bacterium EtOH-i3]